MTEDGVSITSRREGEVTTVTIGGEIDLLTAPRVRETLLALASDGRVNVVIDGRPITFIDASGIRALIEAHAALKNDGSRLVMIPSRAVQRLHSLLELDGHLPTFVTADEAFPNIDRNDI
jgi:anti-sigma B factor antagonist